jgi:hypothetical protein
MSSTSKNDLTAELLSIIQKEVQQPDMETYRILYTIVRIYIHALSKIMKIKDDETYAYTCADLVVHIFKIMYQYTKHGKASKEMAERVVVMFQEYLYTSMSLNSIETYLSEIKEFIIDKTVGNIYLYRQFQHKPSMSPTSKYVFQPESLDILCGFIKVLFLRLITLYKYQSNLGSTSPSVSLFQSLRESRVERKVEDTTDMYFIDEPLSTDRSEEIQLDYIDLVEEHLITSAILLHINIDKWVILNKGKYIEPFIHQMIGTIQKVEDIIPRVNNLKLRLECMYYGASYYTKIEDSFSNINEIIDDYEADMPDDEDELAQDYIDIQTDIKDYRPFQMRMYRIYDQKNKQV